MMLIVIIMGMMMSRIYINYNATDGHNHLIVVFIMTFPNEDNS